MADEKLTQITSSAAIADTDLVAMVKDMGTTPLTVSRAWSLIKSTLKTYFDTLYTNVVKASGAELDTGTNDDKFATAKAIKDAHNVPSVAPSTSGNVLTSNGTDWTSAAAGGGGTWGSITGTLSAQTDLGYALAMPEGVMRNGKILVSVASNNITLALKTLAGNDPSASEPVYAIIGGVLRTITAALSVTKNAATNWFNSGGTDLKTQQIDYFAYLGYNATDGVVIGFARIPWGRRYDSFSVTSTAGTYCAISTITNAAAADYYTVIGRFPATLSAAAGYTWTVPTFTAANLIQRPIDETEWLTWAPTVTAQGGTPTTTTPSCKYRFVGSLLYVNGSVTVVDKGTATGAVDLTVPWTIIANGYLHGMESAATAQMTTGTYYATSHIWLFFYNAGTLWVNNYNATFSGFLQAA